LVALGRTDEAIAEGRTAIELDAGSVSIRRSYGWLHYHARRYEPAAEQLRRALLMNPTAEETHRILGLILMQQRRYDEAAASLREALSYASVSHYASAALGYCEALAGRPAEAERRLAELQAEARDHYVSPVAFTLLSVGLGRHDDAFGWLERVREERRGWMAYLNVEPLLDPIRNDPRFTRLVRAMRLP
jgi:serine/threonine-protein kinase